MVPGGVAVVEEKILILARKFDLIAPGSGERQGILHLGIDRPHVHRRLGDAAVTAPIARVDDAHGDHHPPRLHQRAGDAVTPPGIPADDGGAVIEAEMPTCVPFQ